MRPGRGVAGAAILLILHLSACVPWLAGDKREDRPAGETFVYECNGQYRFTARVEGGSVWLFLPRVTVNLPHVTSASGARYQSKDYLFWSKGQEAQLEGPAGQQYRCVNNRAAAIWEAAKLNGVDFRAVGNEPGWWLTIDPERVVLVSHYGEQRVEFPVPEAETDVDRLLTRYRSRRAGREIVIELQAVGCRDSMSGEEFPARVSVSIGAERLQGCGRPLH